MRLKIIGVMTGNSMDAIDVVLTEFDGESMKDICSLSTPYSVEQKLEIDGLRNRVVNEKLSSDELLKDDDFIRIHNDYVKGIAEAIKKLCDKNHIDKSEISAIGFHGKTLDHNPPSVAKLNGTLPFTTQMGSAQMLADLTGIPVINDFRSQLVMSGFEGAPLAGPHNAHIAIIEGDGCYFNAGNTSNLAWIKNAKSQISWDAGPFNEYTDNFILRYKGQNMDTDAHYGLKGKLLPDLLEYLFSVCGEYYDLLPPKSGDPAHYKTTEIFDYIEKKYGNPSGDDEIFCDVIHTFEYFSAYVAAWALTQTPEYVEMTERIILFGGGWKNPLALRSFKELLKGQGFILPRHKSNFNRLKEFAKPNIEIIYSKFGDFMEARLFADLAYYNLQNKTWPSADLEGAQFCLGNKRVPHGGEIDDYLSKAARGWNNN